MSTVIPARSAYLLGSPDVELTVMSGSIEEDAGRAPRWTAQLEVVVSEATYDALDPRQSRRVRIDVEQLEGVTTTERSFDFTLRSRDRDSFGVVRIGLASDEALAIDWARTTRGWGDYGSYDLRTAVEWALRQAINIPNLNPNPDGATNTTGWSVITGSGAATLGRLSAPIDGGMRWTLRSVVSSPSVPWWALRTTDITGIVPGTRYTAHALANTDAASPALQLYLEWYNGATLLSSTTPGTASTTGWQTLETTGVAPATADRLRIVVRNNSSGVTNKVLSMTSVQVSAGAYPPINVTGENADIEPFWEATNLMTNPTVANTVTGYGAGTNTASVTWDNTDGSIGTTSVRWTSSAAGDSWLGCRTFPVLPDQVYYMRCDVKATAGRNLRLVARFRDDDGNLIKDVVSSTFVANGAWTQLLMVLTVPRGSANLSYNVVQTATAGAQPALGDGFMLVQLPENNDVWLDTLGYFDGSNPGAGYTASWSGTAHASSSTRFPIVTREPDSLIWEAGVKAWDFIDPLVQSAGLRLVCDETRHWSLVDADYVRPGTLPDLEYGENIHDSGDVVTREDEEWFDCAVVEWRWDRRGIEQAVDETYALTTPYTKTMTVTRNSPYPGAGLAQYLVERAQGRGRELSASARTVWPTSVDMLVGVHLEQDASPVSCKVQTVSFDLNAEQMSVTLRTV